MRPFKLALLYLFAIILTSCQPACPDPAGCLQHPILIGAEKVTAGKSRARNQELLKGFQLALQTTASKNAPAVNLWVEETTCTSPRAGQAVNRLVQRSTLAFVLGPACPLDAYLPSNFSTTLNLAQIPQINAAPPPADPDSIAQMLSRQFAPGPVLIIRPVEDIDFAAQLCTALNKFNFSCLLPITLEDGSFTFSEPLAAPPSFSIVFAPASQTSALFIPPELQFIPWIVYDPYTLPWRADTIPEGWFWLANAPTNLDPDLTTAYQFQFQAQPETIDFYTGYATAQKILNSFQQTSATSTTGASWYSRADLNSALTTINESISLPLALFLHINSRLVLKVY